MLCAESASKSMVWELGTKRRTYMLPNKNIAATPNFFFLDVCSLEISWMGSVSVMKSIMQFAIELPRKKRMLLIHFVFGSVCISKCQNALSGRHWRKLTSSMATIQPIHIEPMMKQPSFTTLVGKMRQ